VVAVVVIVGRDCVLVAGAGADVIGRFLQQLLCGGYRRVDVYIYIYKRVVVRSAMSMSEAQQLGSATLSL
jgi:hypothetical protein